MKTKSRNDDYTSYKNNNLWLFDERFMIYNYVRAFFGAACFLIGWHLFINLFYAGFSFLVLLGSIVSFIAAHFFWPAGEWDLETMDLIEVTVSAVVF